MTATIARSTWRRPAVVVVAVLVAVLAFIRRDDIMATLRSPVAVAKLGAIFLAWWLLWRFLLAPRVQHRTARAVLRAVPFVVAGALVAPSFTNHRVREPLPSASPSRPATAAAPVASPPAPSPPAAPSGPMKVTSGVLAGIGHRASGEAAVYRLEDGSLIVRLEDIDVQNGPDYLVYLVPSAGARSPGSGVSLGRLKGNQGSQNYPVPPGVDVSGPHTVLIWCRVFSTPVAGATQTTA